MNKMNKVAALVCAMLVFGYITRTKDETPEPHAPASRPAASDIGGPLLGEPPDESWADDETTGYNGFTTLAQLGAKESSIGVLTIEKIGVSVHVFDSDEGSITEDMKKGAAHYCTTSY